MGKKLMNGTIHYSIALRNKKVKYCVTGWKGEESTSYPDPQFYFTSEDNTLISTEGRTINISPSANQPLRLHVKTASPMNNIIINQITAANGSPANWLNVSYDHFQKGGVGSVASFDLIFRVTQKPGVGQTYSATSEIHGGKGGIGCNDYRGDFQHFIDEVLTINMTGE